MALQPPVVARQTGTAGLSRYPLQGCRCGLARTSAPFCIHLEKFHLVSKSQPSYNVYGPGKSVHFPRVVLTHSTQTSFATLEEVEIAGWSDVLRKSSPTEVEQNEQPLPIVEAVPNPQNTSSTLEPLKDASSMSGTLNKPLLVTTVESGTGDASFSDASQSQPPITSPDITIPSAEEAMNAAAIATGAASESSQEATTSATDALSSDQFKSAKEAYEALLSGAGDATEQGSSSDALSRTSQTLADEFSETKSAIVKGLTELQESIQDSVDSTKLSLKSTYDNINGSIVSAFKGGILPDKNPNTELVPKVAKVVNSQEYFTQLLTSPFQMGTPVNNALKQIVTAVENITGRAVTGVGELVANGYSSTKEVLPVNVQVHLSSLEQKISEVSGPLQSVLQQGYNIILDAERAVGINPENPIIPIILVIGGGFSLGLLYGQLRFGGYSGDLSPASALDVLKKEGSVVLVDIRPEDLRESEGIPDLRRQARFKAASVAQFKVQNALQKMLKNTVDAEAAITASAIKNLKNVQRNTTIILLDSDGSQSKSIARALKKAGIQISYRIDGGFKAWEANGLRVKQVGPETPLTIIKEETEAILDEVKPTPFGIGAASLGVFAGLYALIEWEKTFQFLGIVCICQVLYMRLNSYESADDAKNDLKLLLRPFALATQGIVWAAGAMEPSKLQLATSPSTSAVQNRVLQAAAKHGPLPSEADQEQQEVGDESQAPDADADAPEVMLEIRAAREKGKIVFYRDGRVVILERRST
ncbi:hypothetical protein GOP47_0021926 [Adiantum capillus-veneris]|uniref:Rhodanese domain-containing protein n=1 Tax=Adiantum capillus-veneris TaxID=13818 RepID=A0A9D4U8C7_ADICA|nr:hypothetical protein GOP47_0021926 [Adiantum capillus-veneris]